MIIKVKTQGITTVKEVCSCEVDTNKDEIEIKGNIPTKRRVHK